MNSCNVNDYILRMKYEIYKKLLKSIAIFTSIGNFDSLSVIFNEKI